MTELDAVIDRVRRATVNRAAAERYVRELDRWAGHEARGRRVPWFAAACVVAAALAVALWPRGEAPREAVAPVWLGERVALVAEPATAYRVVHADAATTEIAVERGAVTVRLWHATAPHRLALSGGGVTAIATGTVYRLAVGATGASVHVLDGSVEVRAADGVHVVGAGASWPAIASARDRTVHGALLALAVPRSSTVATPAAPSAPAAATTAASAAIDAEHSSPAADAPAPAPASPASPAIRDRWRTARLLRAQGKFTAALAECLAIADARDPMWSPIALVEAVRIELGPLADPERAIALADRMIRAWPNDALASEARELRCRALRQLGRGEACGSPPP
jgi:hypothetical protein